jgi:acyl-CoA synthetase (AMP-forming)/AMP-acid ligase II
VTGQEQSGQEQSGQERSGQERFDWARWSSDGWRTHGGPAEPVLGGDTIPALAAASASAWPDKVAVTVDGEPLTHAELDDAAARIAGWLRQRGIAPGDRVLIVAGASVGFVRCYLGALRAGAVVVLANPAYTAAELAHLVADSGAVLAFTQPGAPAGIASVDIDRVVPGGTGPEGPRGGITPTADDIALLAYTSGTTGTPKGVPLTHRNLIASIRRAMTAWRWSDDDVLVHALPMFHQHGLSGLHAALIAGGSMHVLSKFAPPTLIAALCAARATVLFGVPTIYQALLDHGVRVPDLRLAVCGSAPLSPALAARIPEILGMLPLVRYGTTETGLNISNPIDAPRPGTIGVPLPGSGIRLADDGEIQIRGPQVFGGYWHDAGAFADAFTGDGWFRSGDIAALQDSHLVIKGRSKEMIITGGLNVYPREVEIALESHPSVREAAVAGRPHERWGEQVTAWVVIRAGHDFDEAALIAHARISLAPYKCPKQVLRMPELPRNALGKITRSALS